MLALGDSNLAYEARKHRASVYERLERFAAAATDYAAIADDNYELFLDKARTLKLAGDRAGAARAIDEYLTAIRALLKDQGEAGDSYTGNKLAEAEALKKELIGSKKQPDPNLMI